MTNVIFAGQGSQYPGMGEIINQSSENKELMEIVEFWLKNDHWLERHLTEDDNGEQIDWQEKIPWLRTSLEDIMLNADGNELRNTINAQPAIFVYNHMLYNSLRDKIEPTYFLGHSLGEFNAAVATGALTFEDGVRLIKIRAGLMDHLARQLQNSVENPDEKLYYMAIVKPPTGNEEEIVKQIEQMCQEVTDDENYVGLVLDNYKDQKILSGHPVYVEKMVNNIKNVFSGKVKTLFLKNAGGPFHTPYMSKAEDKLREAFQEYMKKAEDRFRSPKIPLICNYTGKPTVNPHEIRENLIKQVSGKIKWDKSLEYAFKDVKDFIEIGPKKPHSLSIIKFYDGVCPL